MISNMTSMKNVNHIVRVKGNVHRSPFEQVDRVKMRPVFVLPSTKATVHDQIAVTVTYAPSVNARATVSQPVEPRVKNPSQPHQPTKYEPVNTGHFLPTPVKHNVLECMLQGYDCRSKTSLILGFESGFRINSSIDTDPRKGLYENHKSVNDNLSIVQTKLDKEKALGRIAGPCQNPPLYNMVVSPLGLVPKREPGYFRLIHDLSYPKENSVNAHIAPEFSSVSFEMLDDCISIMLELGKGCLVAKADIKDAFRIISISPLHYRLLGFKFKGQFYFDMCLPMGCSTSCQTFESFSQAVQWICVHKANILHISHIIDDFIFFGKTISRCQLYLDRFF